MTKYTDDLMLYIALVLSMFSDLSSTADCTDAISTWFMESAMLSLPATSITATRLVN